MGGPIDLRHVEAARPLLWFRKYEQPFFSVTVDVDVTAAWNASRTRGAPSFFLTSLFLMLNAANESRRSGCACGRAACGATTASP